MPASPTAPARPPLLPAWLHAALLALLLLCTSLPATASMYNMRFPGAWPGGRINWTYNPANRPANISDDEIIAAVSAAFAAWKLVCQVEGTYAGLSTATISPSPITSFVVGWLDFGSDQFHARGSHTSSNSGNYRPFTGGAIQINIANLNLRGLLDDGFMAGVFKHEIGHVLGLSHSDDPSSIMFANPYNGSRYYNNITGDDVAACADLYGGRGVAATQDLRAAPITSPLPVQAFVLASPATATVPTSSLAQITPTSGASYYFVTYWNQLPLGTELQRRWIAPNGNLFQTNTAANTSIASGRSTSLSTDYRFPFTGTWALQVTVNDQVGASVPFEVTRGEIDPVAGFEMALLGERDTGTPTLYKWRAVPYGRGSPSVAQRLVVNGQAASALTTTLQTGANTVALWMETDRPRYKLDQDDGQPAHSYDVMRQISFNAAANGTLLPAAPVVTASGTAPSASFSAALTMGAQQDYNIYVALMYNGVLLFRGPAGWTTTFGTALTTAKGPAVALVDLLRNHDIRTLPAGTTLWVGYGGDLVEMLNKGQFALARQF